MLKPLVLTAGTSFQETFLLYALDFKQTRSGANYAELILSYGSDRITGTLWIENTSDLDCKEGQIVAIQGHVSGATGSFQIHIDVVEPMNETDLDPTHFLSTTELDREAMCAALMGKISTIEDHHIRELLTRFFDDHDLSSRFQNAPASLTGHHAYSGGLLEHILSVLHVLDDMEKHYGRYYPGLVDRNYLLAGGFLHNLGRIFELHWSDTSSNTNSGPRIGHRIKSVVMLDKIASQIPDFPAKKLERLQHLVTAQPGSAPDDVTGESRTLEAFLVHDLARIDASISRFYDTCRRAKPNAWTLFQPDFGGPLHNPLRGEHPGPGVFWSPQMNLNDTVEIKAPQGEAVFFSPVLSDDHSLSTCTETRPSKPKRRQKSAKNRKSEIPAAIRDLFGPEH